MMDEWAGVANMQAILANMQAILLETRSIPTGLKWTQGLVKPD